MIYNDDTPPNLTVERPDTLENSQWRLLQETVQAEALEELILLMINGEFAIPAEW